MSSAWKRPARALAAHTAIVTMIGLGLAAPAAAAPGEPGSGKGSDKAASATAEASEKKSTTGASSADTKTRGGKSGTKSAPSGRGHDDDRRTQTGEQPVSKADQNTGGANGQCSDTSEDEGYFCGTDRTGKASGNGQGKGAAVGKPYQAHKGKADNKNPPGQAENDHNNGYECDGNQGIAKGNPAHTSCDTAPPTTTTETCPDGSPLPASGDVKDCDKGTPPGGKTCPDGSPLPASGNAEDCDETTTPPGPPAVVPPGIGGVETEVPEANRPPVVAGVEAFAPPAGVELVRPPADAGASAPQASPSAAVLPATGASSMMTLLSALAFGLLALGAGTLMYRRVNG